MAQYTTLPQRNKTGKAKKVASVSFPIKVKQNSRMDFIIIKFPDNCENEQFPDL